MAEKNGTLKNQYENAKRYTIALWAEKLRDCTPEEEMLVVDYKGKIITVTSTLEKQKRKDMFKAHLEDEMNNIMLFLGGEKTHDELKKDYDKFVASAPTITNTGVSNRKFNAKKTLDDIVKFAKRFGNKKFVEDIEKAIKDNGIENQLKR